MDRASFALRPFYGICLAIGLTLVCPISARAQGVRCEQIFNGNSAPAESTPLQVGEETLVTRKVVPKLFGFFDGNRWAFASSVRKIHSMFLDSKREMVFQKNYGAALALLNRQNIKVNWAPQGPGLIRGMMFVPGNETLIAQQAQAMMTKTGYRAVYSAEAGWFHRIKGIFQGGAISLSVPLAINDRKNKVIYVSKDTILEGRFGTIEEHEFVHALLNQFEDGGRDTGIFLPKLHAEKRGRGTRISAYPRGIDLQELYTFGNQIKSMGERLLAMDPKSSQAKEALEELQEYFDIYQEILVGINLAAKDVVDRLEKGPDIVTIDEEGLRIQANGHLYFRIAPGESSADRISSLKERFTAITRSTYDVDRKLRAFLDSPDMEVSDEKGWTPEFRELILAPTKFLFEGNRKFLKSDSAALENELRDFRQYFP